MASCAGVVAMPGVAETIEVSYDLPTFDRWAYLYNGTPGVRGSAPVFGAVGTPAFDERDGQMLIGFSTGVEIPAGLGAASYRVISATVTVMAATDNAFIYDPTVDEWASYQSGATDGDAGRPLELFAAGFRGGFDGWTFGEDGPLPFGAPRYGRNVFAMGRDATGAWVDVSNSVTQEWTPTPLAIGQTDDVLPGDSVPSETTLTFEIDIEEAGCLFPAALNDGLVEFMLAPLHEAQQPLAVTYPEMYLKEHPMVEYDLADAARLTMMVEVTTGSGVVGDLTGDGVVGVQDLLVILDAWGACGCCAADLDGDEAVGVQDLLIILDHWG
jgi:hypothetical protein